MEEKKNKTKKVEENIEIPKKVLEKKIIKNCLRNEIIKVKFVSRNTWAGLDPRSPMYGGKADTAVFEYCVPLLRNGNLGDPLTRDEKECLEHELNLEENALSIYKKPCYWLTTTKNAFNMVRLTKDGTTLDLSSPEDYIYYKILLMHKEEICPSWEELQRNPKPTYWFVLCNDESEANSLGSKNECKRMANKKFDAIFDEADLLRMVIELIEGRRLAPKTPVEQLQEKVLNYIDTKPKIALDALSDDMLEYKSVIKVGVEKKVIEVRNGLYYLKENHQKLCDEFEDTPTLNISARFIADVNNKDLYMKILKDIK